MFQEKVKPNCLYVCVCVCLSSNCNKGGSVNCRSNKNGANKMALQGHDKLKIEK